MSAYNEQLVYLAHPRTGSVATEDALYRTFPDITKTDDHHIHVRPGDRNQLVFTTIRNPIDCLRSWWSMHPGDISFVDFITTSQDDRMIRDGMLFYHFQYCGGEVLRFEHLETDLNFLLRAYDLVEEWITVKRMNVTETKKNFVVCDQVTAAMWKRFPWEMALYYGVQ